MSSVKFFFLVVFSLSLSTRSSFDNQIKSNPTFPDHWYEVSNINGEQVIFIPCDYQNTEFILSNSDDKHEFVEVTGQDGWKSEIEEIIQIDNKTMKVSIVRPDDLKVSFMVTEINTRLYNWTWKERDYDGSMIEYSINMTPQEHKDSFKVVEEPPCM